MMPIMSAQYNYAQAYDSEGVTAVTFHFMTDFKPAPALFLPGAVQLAGHVSY